MPLSNWFWIFYVLYVLFGFWRNYDAAQPWYRWGGAHVFNLVLLFLLGWAVFQGPVK
jgi:hypothetical protein